MPRKTNTEKDKRGNRRPTENRTPRPKPKIDFTEDALDFKNINLLKQYRRVAPRYEKTARNFLGFVHIASIMILLR